MSTFKIAISDLPIGQEYHVGGFSWLILYRHKDDEVFLAAHSEILASVIVREGDVLRVEKCGRSSTLSVATPPPNPTKAMLWSYGFTARQQADSLEALTYGQPVVWRIGTARDYRLEGGASEPEMQDGFVRSPDGRIALRLRRTWEGRRGYVPGGYFIANDVTPEEAEAFLVAWQRERKW